MIWYLWYWRGYVLLLSWLSDWSIPHNTYTVLTHINLRRFIKIWGFQGGGLLKILPIKASKSLKKWTFGPKKWRFIQILLYWWFNQEWSFICVDTVRLKISENIKKVSFKLPFQVVLKEHHFDFLHYFWAYVLGG